MPKLSGAQRQTVAAEARPSLAAQRMIDNDVSRYVNNLACEQDIRNLRVHNHLARTNPTVEGPGRVAMFPNAIVRNNGRHVLAVETSIEPGTILADNTWTMVEWESYNGGEAHGHVRGNSPYVVGTPTTPVPEAEIEVLAGKFRPEDLDSFPLAKAIHVPAWTATNLRDIVNYYRSPNYREDILHRLLGGNDSIFAGLRHHMLREADRRNADRAGTDRGDLAGWVYFEMVRLIDRYASPDRPLGGGPLTTVLQREVPKYVERHTISSAGISQRDAAARAKARAVGIDFDNDTTEEIHRALEAATGDADDVEIKPTDIARIERISAADRKLTSRSLDAPGIGEGTNTLADTQGGLDHGYDQVDEDLSAIHPAEALRKLATQVTFGAGFLHADEAIDQLATWLAHITANAGDPTPEDLRDPATGWTAATWVFAPLLTTSDAWTKRGVRERVLGRIHNIAFRGAGAYRSPEDVARIWAHYLTSKEHQQRAATPPAGIVLDS